MPRKKKDDPKDPEANWATSKARILLKDDIIAGRVTNKMTNAQVKAMRPEFAKWPVRNYGTNLKSLKDAVARDHGRMLWDCQFYGNDIAIVKK